MGRWAEDLPWGVLFSAWGWSLFWRGIRYMLGKRSHLAKCPLPPGSGSAAEHLTLLSRPPLRANVLETNNKDFLKTCHFSSKNLYCPIFRLGSIVRWAGADFQDIALKVCGQGVLGTWALQREGEGGGTLGHLSSGAHYFQNWL